VVKLQLSAPQSPYPQASATNQTTSYARFATARPAAPALMSDHPDWVMPPFHDGP